MIDAEEHILILAKKIPLVRRDLFCMVNRIISYLSVIRIRYQGFQMVEMLKISLFITKKQVLLWHLLFCLYWNIPQKITPIFRIIISQNLNLCENHYMF